MISGSVHFIGIGGRAMGAIAAALARAGVRVTGSDEDMYEPMRSWLDAARVEVMPRYAEENVPPDTALVVVGKRITEANSELQGVLRRSIPFTSFPCLLQQYFLRTSRNAVVAGGVGKTTTTAMLAWILEHVGRTPDYLIGGLPRNFDAPARFDGAALTVLEGDEYASCFDDLSPKFLHYEAEVAIVTNVLADHPDLYPDQASLYQAFVRLAQSLPVNGCLVLAADDGATPVLSAAARCRVRTVGVGEHAEVRVEDVELDAEGSSFSLLGSRVRVPMCGQMNVRNAAMAVVAATHLGVSPAGAASALEHFAGVRDRQEERDAGRCTIVTDKASHPESLRELAAALRQRFPDRRLVSVIQPRATGGRHWIYQRDLPAALSAFDRVIVASAYEHHPPAQTAWQHHPFSLDALAEQLTARGADVSVVAGLEYLPAALTAAVRDEDVVVVSLREQFVGAIAGLEAALGERFAVLP